MERLLLESFAAIVAQDVGLRVAAKYAMGDLLYLAAENERLYNLASTDSLTGLLNNCAFVQRADSEIRRANRHASALTLMRLDVEPEDETTASTGAFDGVLKGFCSVLLKTTRAEDIIGRLGGGAFALLLPETDMDRAPMVFSRLQQMLDQQGMAANLAIRAGFSEPLLGERDIQGALDRSETALIAARDWQEPFRTSGRGRGVPQTPRGISPRADGRSGSV